MVTLSKKFLRSTALQKADANGRLIITEYGSPGSSDPEKNIISRTISNIVPGEMTDNCACNVFDLGGVTVTATETALLR